MSYFIFGVIELRAGDAVDRDELAWRACECGADVRLNALVGPNVRQRSVCDVIIAQALTGDGRVPFILTSSPFRDTSGELVLPGGWPNDHDGLSRLMVRVERWLRVLLDTAGVERVVLFMSEGYDDNFVELNVFVSEFAIQTLAQMNDPAWLPSLRVCVRRQVPSVE